MDGTINERIAALIAALGISRTQFAKSIRLSQPYVSAICSGGKQPSDRTIADICRVYGVSEGWLRDGTGEMYVPRTMRQEVLDLGRELLDAPPGDFRREFLLALADLPPEFWPALRDFMKGCIGSE